MNTANKKSIIPSSTEPGGLIAVSFGSVTIQAMQPSESVRRANIEAGQAALRRGKKALVKAGITLIREKGIPLFFGCEDRPGWLVRELDGKKTVGRFVCGRFVAEKPAIVPKLKKRLTKT